MEIDWNEYALFAKQYLARGKQISSLSLVDELLAQRDRLVAQGHIGKLAAVKGLVNSLYGVLSYSGFRLYTPEIPARVTEIARNVIRALIAEVQDWGYTVNYCDTDSLVVVSPEDLTERLNAALRQFGDFTIKIDKRFVSAIFLNAKKKYAGLLADGTLDIAGFERIRSDSSTYTQRVQETVLRMALEDRTTEIVPYLIEMINGVKKVPLEELAFTKGLSKDLEDYSGVQQNYILSAKQQGLDLKEGDSVRLLPALNYPHNMAVFQDLSDLKTPPQIDYRAIVDKQIKAKVEDILNVLQINWSETTGQRRML